MLRRTPSSISNGRGHPSAMTSKSTNSDKPAYLQPRVLVRLFVVFVLLGFAVGYSHVLQSAWTNIFPQACAEGKSDLFTVDFESFPTRIGDQDNLCAHLDDGQCTRKNGDEIIHGICTHAAMHGRWSVTNKMSGLSKWTGNYCEGLPCGTFRVRVDDTHENEFYLEKLHLHGEAKIWERQGTRLTEFSGRYDRGRRSGQWFRYLEPSHTRMYSAIYDKAGYLTTSTVYCTNGHRKESRGANIFIFNAQNTLIAKRVAREDAIENANQVPTNVDDPALCPLP